MTWEYRVFYDPDEELFWIGELYGDQDNDDTFDGTYTGTVGIGGNSIDEVIDDLNYHEQALMLPVITLMKSGKVISFKTPSLNCSCGKLLTQHYA